MGFHGCSVRDISGATVEHNKFCVSVHFRNVDASQYDNVLAAVESTLKQHEELHATRGRKVFEIRPQVLPCLYLVSCVPLHECLELFELRGIFQCPYIQLLAMHEGFPYNGSQPLAAAPW